VSTNDVDRVEVQSIAQWWGWLADHHADSSGVWLVTWKVAHRDRYVSRDEVLDALIAFGWVDGRRKKLDDDRTMQLVTPRKEQAWARTYIERAERLEAEGRMQPPGRAAIEEAKANGRYLSMREVDDLVEPEALLEALRTARATSWWTNAAPSYRRNILRWIAKAKRASTKEKRITSVVEHCVRGEKVPNY
jgi:uncharacterized protein YdeI (YjbR/CyaY-like superfamily)